MFYDFNLNFYKDILAKKESGNSYTKDSGNGAYGKYQFLEQTIVSISKILNLPVPSIQEFLSNPVLQEKYLKALIQDSLDYIRNNNLEQFFGKEISGMGNGIETKINVYGLIAGIHLSGANNLKNFLDYGTDKSDANGTYISDYVAYFSKATMGLKKKSDFINNGDNNPKIELILTAIETSLKNLNKLLSELKNAD